MTAFNLAKTLAKFTIDFTELSEAWDPEQLIMQVDASCSSLKLSKKLRNQNKKTDNTAAEVNLVHCGHRRRPIAKPVSKYIFFNYFIPAPMLKR